jgi:hypothetical protein
VLCSNFHISVKELKYHAVISLFMKFIKVYVEGLIYILNLQHTLIYIYIYILTNIKYDIVKNAQCKK